MLRIILHQWNLCARIAPFRLLCWSFCRWIWNQWMTRGCIHSERSQSNYQMQCDIVPCLLWKTSLCNVFIQNTIFFCNYIYLLMIFHKFKVISLSFESLFMHIKHLKCSHQIMLLDLNFFFVNQMCTIHSQSLRKDSY